MHNDALDWWKTILGRGSQFSCNKKISASILHQQLKQRLAGRHLLPVAVFLLFDSNTELTLCSNVMWPHICKISISVWFAVTSPWERKKASELSQLLHGQRNDGTDHMEIQTCFQAALEFAFHNESSVWDYFHSVPQIHQEG